LNHDTTRNTLLAAAASVVSTPIAIALVVAGIVIGSFFVATASASASGYNLSQRQAERRAIWTANDLFVISETGSSCRPQGTRVDPVQRLPSTYKRHRWTCVVSALGANGDEGGVLIIAGHSDGNYSYRIIRWG
jgi:hypothetical protein